MENIYTKIESQYGNLCITRINEDGTLTIFPEDPANSDYQQYLIDTDG